MLWRRSTHGILCDDYRRACLEMVPAGGGPLHQRGYGVALGWLDQEGMELVQLCLSLVDWDLTMHADLTTQRREEVCDRSFLWLVLALSAGLVAGATGSSEGRPETALSLGSRCAGWMYFFCWSVSFWPQIHSNCWARSTVGLSDDFLLLNWFGFLCYAVFNSALFFSPTIREQYQQRNNVQVPVQANDVLFALHGFAATTITLCQAAVYRTGSGNSPQVASAELRSSQRVAIIRTFSGILLSLFFLGVALLVLLVFAESSLIATSYLDILYLLAGEMHSLWRFASIGRQALAGPFLVSALLQSACTRRLGACVCPHCHSRTGPGRVSS